MTEAFKEEVVQHITRNLIDIQVLRLVRTQPMWGYKIKKRVKELFGIKLRHGALYPLLRNLEEKGLLTSETRKERGRIRKVYTLTRKGRQYLETYNSVLRDQLKCKDIE